MYSKALLLEMLGPKMQRVATGDLPIPGHDHTAPNHLYGFQPADSE